MYRRVAASFLFVVLAASLATADVLIVKDRRGNLEIEGIDREIDDTPITRDNVVEFLDRSEGEVVFDGYHEVQFAAKSGRNPRAYPREDVVEVLYSSEPESLTYGYDAVASNNLGQALADFRDVYEDDGVRQVFRTQAAYMIGQVYIRNRSLKSALEWYEKWEAEKSIYTPEVYRSCALIYMSAQQYPNARTWFSKIEQLPGLPANARLMAKLGQVEVDILERKYDQAEQTAGSIASEAAGKEEARDAAVMAAALQGQAILAGGNKDRFNEAEVLLNNAAKLQGASDSSRARLYLTLGSALYAQGRLEEARFPYMRVVCLFPDQQAQVADSLLNAGQIYLDLAGHAANAGNQESSDDLFVKGMKLLYECAARYKAFGASRAAGKKYLENKARYQALVKSEGEEPAEDEPGGEEGD